MADSSIQAAEQLVVRHALNKGFLSEKQLRQALLLQEQLKSQGRQSDLLPILGTRFVRPEHLGELRAVWSSAAKGAPVNRPPDISPEMLASSGELMSRPPEQDPAPVKKFLHETLAGRPAHGFDPTEMPTMTGDEDVTLTGDSGSGAYGGFGSGAGPLGAGSGAGRPGTAFGQGPGSAFGPPGPTPSNFGPPPSPGGFGSQGSNFGAPGGGSNFGGQGSAFGRPAGPPASAPGSAFGGPPASAFGGPPASAFGGRAGSAFGGPGSAGSAFGRPPSGPGSAFPGGPAPSGPGSAFPGGPAPSGPGSAFPGGPAPGSAFGAGPGTGFGSGPAGSAFGGGGAAPFGQAPPPFAINDRADTRREDTHAGGQAAPEGETLAESSEDRGAGGQAFGGGRGKGTSRKALVAVAIVAAAIPTAVAAVIIARSAGARSTAAAEFQASYGTLIAGAQDSAKSSAERVQSAHDALVAARRWKDNDPKNPATGPAAGEAYLALGRAHVAAERWESAEAAFARAEQVAADVADPEVSKGLEDARAELEEKRTAAAKERKARVEVLLGALDSKGPGRGPGRDELARSLGRVVESATAPLLAARLDRVTETLREIERTLYLEAEKASEGEPAKTIEGLAAALEKLKERTLGATLEPKWQGSLDAAAKRLLLREAKVASAAGRAPAVRIEQLVARRQRDQIGAELDVVIVVCNALGYSGAHDESVYSALSRFLAACADSSVARPAAYALARLDSEVRAQELLSMALEGLGSTSPLVVQLETLTSRTKGPLLLEAPKTAEAFLRHGLLLRARGELGAASGMFQKASELDAGNSEAFGRLAEAQVALGNLNAASRAASKALKLNRKNPIALLASGLAKQGSDSLEPALQEFSRLGEVDADNPRSLSARGLARLEFGDEEGALADFQRAALFDSGWGQAWLGRGRVKHEQGDLAGAAADLTQAIELGELRALGARGAARRGLGDAAGSISDYTRALARSEKAPELWDGRGHSFLSLKDFAKAIKDFEKASSLAPQSAKYLASLGKAYYEQGDLQKSVIQYSKALEKDQQDPRLWLARGQALLSRVNDKAIEDYDRAIELDPKDPLLFEHRGMAFMIKMMVPEALEDFNRAIELDPMRSGPYKLRADLLLTRAQKPKAALEDYERALKLNPRVEDAYCNMSMCYMVQKDFAGAAKVLDRANEALPYAPTPYLRRGILLQQEEKWAESLTQFDKALELDARVVEAVFRRAYTHFSMDNKPAAIKDLRSFLKLAPKHPLAKNARALLQNLRSGG